MLVLAVALLVGFMAYAATEWAQTRRFDSIARQFSTRTIVLMALAIPINVVLGQTVASALKLPVYLDSIGTILVGVLAGPFAGAATGLLSNLAWTFVLGGTPLGSPFAWPCAIVAAAIGFMAGLFGAAGVFRTRPGTSPARLAAGVAVAVGVLGALAIWGVLPYYRNLCDPQGTGAAASPSLCFQLLAPAVDAPLALRLLGVVALAVLALGIAAVVIRLVRSRDLGILVTLGAGVVAGVISAFIAAPIAALVFGGVTGSGTDLLVALFRQAGADLQTAVLQQALISDPIDKAISFVVVFAVIAAMSRRVLARFPQGERVLPAPEA